MLMARLVGCVLAASFPSAIYAQECTIGVDQLVGVTGKDGSCHGFERGFSEKYLHIKQSQCAPPPLHGHLLLDKCIPDAPPLPKEADIPDDVQQLKAMVIELDGDVAQLREEMAAQYNELMSEIGFLKSELARRER